MAHPARATGEHFHNGAGIESLPADCLKGRTKRAPYLACRNGTQNCTVVP